MIRLIPQALLISALCGLAPTPGFTSPESARAPAKSAASPLLKANPAKRKAVRGCPVGAHCQRIARDDLEQFEREAFAEPAGNSPWARKKATTAPKRPKTALELRPDLPWLADLRLPDIPMQWDHRIIKFLEFYKDDPRGRNIMGAWLRDQGKYRNLILAQLRNAGLPDDLLYLCMIESSYDPHEYSRVGASGLWQFMPSGGPIYGLTINRWIDERNDPSRSTEAVTMYFLDLYHRFGAWDLALTAFNAGYGAVLRAIATYNTNDLWRLLEEENALPWGSSIYFPKTIAAAIVGHNRERFGFAHIKDAAEVRWDEVDVSRSRSIATLARAAGTDEDTIRKLNPQLLRGRTPPGMANYRVKIPRSASQQFEKRIAALGGASKYDEYILSAGERFEDVATTFGLSRSRLRRLNYIDHEADVSAGDVLLVPRISEAEQQRNQETARAKLYAGGAPRGREGDKLVVAVPPTPVETKGKRRVFYRVVTGDSQHRIAGAFRVQPQDLARWNDLNPTAHLQPRMVLQLFIDPKFDLKKHKIAVLDPKHMTIVTRGSNEHLQETELLMGRKRLKYRAKGRESFEAIGKKFGLGARDLARINRRSHNTVLEPGEEIIVYQVVDETRSKRAAAQAENLRQSRRKARKKK